MLRDPLNLRKANFLQAVFDSTAVFYGAYFSSTANFVGTTFRSTANFELATFDSTANFNQATLDSTANLDGTTFGSTANFELATFKSTASFNRATFDSTANFDGTTFGSTANFELATFESTANFNRATFDSTADFYGANFDGRANFELVTFDSTVTFYVAAFDSTANFAGANFGSTAIFYGAIFDSTVTFYGATFYSAADFCAAMFHRQVSFNSSRLYGVVSFVGATFDSALHADLSLATLGNVIEIGIEKSASVQGYDFMRATFLGPGVLSDTLFTEGDTVDVHINAIKTIEYPGAAIVIHGPVDLKIQLEKFRYLELCDTLDYFSKKDIITTLKEASFKGDDYKRERYELDYILQKSTMYQKESTSFGLYAWWQPITWWRYVYEGAMGLGFRPFRLAWWGLGFIGVFAGLYLILMPAEVNRYLTKKEVTYRRTRAVDFDSLLNCIYFSTMIFLTFRMKSDLLSSFKSEQKKIIVAEWSLGFLAYVAFLTLSEAGSILQTLKSLFVG